MDWVKDFYSSQNDWFNMYLSDINETHNDRVKIIDEANCFGVFIFSEIFNCLSNL